MRHQPRFFLPVLVAAIISAGGLLLPGAAASGDDDTDSRQDDRDAPAVNPEDFTTAVDNPFYPLPPGGRWVYRSTSGERTVVEVTDRTPIIMGVRCVEVRDTVTDDDGLVEDTLDWFAQDSAGNVWYFGEDTKEYANGKVVSTHGSWEAGVDGARPGIIMKAAPRVGDAYQQEFYKGVAEDRGRVIALDRAVSVPAGDFSGVVVTRDTTPLDRLSVENKYYAPGVGNVLVVDLVTGDRTTLRRVTLPG